MDNDATVLGLNSYEFRVYSSLLELGVSSASAIAKKSNVPFGRIYDVLDSLELKGLVRTIPEKTKKFTATSPDNFIELINKRIEGLGRLKEEFSLLKKKKEEKGNEIIEVGRGVNSFYEIIKKRPSPKETLFTFRDNAQYRPEWEASIKGYRKEGVKTKGLIDTNSDNEENIKRLKRIYPNLRSFENTGAGIQVVDESCVVLNLRNSDTIVVIKDEAFAKIMKRLFLLAYENAKKV